MGADLSRFDLVVGSDVPRTAETAIAFGCSVDDEIVYSDPTIDTGIDFHAWWQWDGPFVEIARIIDENGAARGVASTIADAWTALARQLPEQGRALAVSHGGVMELGLVGCLPGVDQATWGQPFSHCEGFELLFDRDRFVEVSFLRFR